MRKRRPSFRDCVRDEPYLLVIMALDLGLTIAVFLGVAYSVQWLVGHLPGVPSFGELLLSMWLANKAQHRWQAYMDDCGEVAKMRLSMEDAEQ